MSPLVRFIKKEPGFAFSLALAAIGCLLAPPSAADLKALDFRALLCLFTLMLIMSGVAGTGFFSAAAVRLVKLAKTTRRLVLTAVGLCFFASMFTTNLVALFTFVPFTLTMLELCGQPRLAVPVVVLQTVAANVGGILSPVGSPQNLYLYTHYGMTPGAFFGAALPIVLAGAALLLLFILPIRDRPLDTSHIATLYLTDAKPLFTYFWLFALCMLGVFGLVNALLMAAVVALVIVALDPKPFAKLDYPLLGTLLCLFLLGGSLTRLNAVRTFLTGLVGGHALLAGALTSQVIGNTPAAILLSGLTGDAVGLLKGVGIGGCGTLLASTASLIPYRAYSAVNASGKGRYVLVFTAVNAVFFAVLYIVGAAG